MDLLSASLLAVGVQAVSIIDCTFAGEWAFTHEELAWPYAVRVLDGVCWAGTAQRSAPRRMETGDVLLMWRPEVSHWSSSPGRLGASLGALLSARGFSRPQPGNTPRAPLRLRLGDPEGPAQGRFLVFVFGYARDDTNALCRVLPGCLDLPAQRSGPAASMHGALEQLLADDRHEPGYAALVQTLAAAVIVGLLREWAMAHGGQRPGGLAGMLDVRFERALAAMHGRPQAPWQLASLAAEAGMSRSLFARHFRSMTGSTAMKYLADLRIQRALALLATTNWPVQRVADEAGLGTEQSLRAGVVRRTGQTPAAWRRSMQRSGVA